VWHIQPMLDDASAWALAGLFTLPLPFLSMIGMRGAIGFFLVALPAGFLTGLLFRAVDPLLDPVWSSFATWAGAESWVVFYLGYIVRLLRAIAENAPHILLFGLVAGDFHSSWWTRGLVLIVTAGFIIVGLFALPLPPPGGVFYLACLAYLGEWFLSLCLVWGETDFLPGLAWARLTMAFDACLGCRWRLVEDPADQFAETTAGRVRFRRVVGRDKGDLTVVVVPAGPLDCSHYDEDFLREHVLIVDRVVSVVVMDMPGFGKSLPGFGYGHTFREGAQTIRDVMDRLGLERVVLVGCSTNGLHAAAAARLDERVVGMVLSQTASLTATEKWAVANAGYCSRCCLQMSGWAQTINCLCAKRWARQWITAGLPERLPPDEASPLEKTLQRRCQVTLSEGGRFCVAGAWQGGIRDHWNMKDPDVGFAIARPIPIEVLWGMNDRSHKSSYFRSITDVLPDALVTPVAEAGHFPELEKPEVFASALSRVIAKVAHD
jgi:pimeloyl-ACP methyl ester carboxylesterase